MSAHESEFKSTVYPQSVAAHGCYYTVHLYHMVNLFNYVVIDFKLLLRREHTVKY